MGHLDDSDRARLSRLEMRVRELVLLLRVLVVVACGNLAGHIIEQWLP